MAVPTTVDTFVDLARKSGLIDPARLEALVQQLPSATPRQLAARLVAAGCLTHFQAEQLLLGKWRGFTIGKFKVLERLGIGGNGTVYLCEHAVVRRKVAIKVLPSAKADNPAALARFYREARAAGALDHPNLVKAHDIDQDNGLHFLVMDYVDGTNLQELVDRIGPLDPVRAAQYVAQTAQGLAFAHQAGLIHRDIKPANILLDRQGVIRLSDLGLARFFCDQDDPLTLRYDEKTVLGTADYVAPEQALNSHDVDARADVYGLGATFHFLLTGQPPFPGGKVAQKLIWHQVKQPTPVQAIRPEVPDEMAAVVARMMSKSPADRLPTAAAVVEALQPWLLPPVPPPTEAELPQLCLAARSPGSSSESGSLGPRRPGTTGSTRTTASGNLFPGEETPNHPGAPPPAATPIPFPLAYTRPATPIHLDMPQAPTPEVTARKETVPSEPAPRAGAPAQKPAGRRLRMLRLALLLLIGLACGSAARRLASQTDAPPTPTPPVLVVDRSGDPGTFPTLAAALRQAPPSARILLRADDWEEALHVPADGLAPVRIEGQAPSGRPVRWRAPRNHPAGQPLLRVTGRAGLHLRGMVLDGEDRLQNLVLIAGPCPGLTLEDLDLTGFRQTAVTLRACAATAERPVTVRHVRVAPAHPAASALAFEARADELNQHLHVSDCRLEGPFSAAVVFDGPAEEIVFTQNRIWKAADAFLYRQAAPAHSLGLVLEGNTLCAVDKNGLHFETLPPAGRSRVVLTRNLFARTTTLAQVDDGNDQPARTPAQWLEAAEIFPRPSGNVCDERGREGFPPLKAAVQVLDLPTDPEDDAHFLRRPEAQ